MKAGLGCDSPPGGARLKLVRRRSPLCICVYLCPSVVVSSARVRLERGGAQRRGVFVRRRPCEMCGLELQDFFGGGLDSLPIIPKRRPAAESAINRSRRRSRV